MSTAEENSLVKSLQSNYPELEILKCFPHPEIKSIKYLKTKSMAVELDFDIQDPQKLC